VSYTHRIGLPHHPALILTDRSTPRRIVFPNGTVHPLTAAQTTFVNVGTMPKGSTWSLMVRHLHDFFSHLFSHFLAFSRPCSLMFAHGGSLSPLIFRSVIGSLIVFVAADAADAPRAVLPPRHPRQRIHACNCKEQSTI